MLNIQSQLQFSDHRSLYDILIPADSKFRQLNELIDFSLIRNELVKNYSKDIGRKAVDPIILFKYLLLKTMNPSSDRDLVARSYKDMSYKRDTLLCRIETELLDFTELRLALRNKCIHIFNHCGQILA